MDPKASEAADWQISTLLTKESLLKGHLSSTSPRLPYAWITLVSELKKGKDGWISSWISGHPSIPLPPAHHRQLTRTTNLSYSAKSFPSSPKILRHLAKVSLTQFSFFQLPHAVQNLSHNLQHADSTCQRQKPLGRNENYLTSQICMEREIDSLMFSFFFLFLWFCF